MNTKGMETTTKRSEIFRLVLATLNEDAITRAIRRMFSGTVIVHDSEEKAWETFWEFVGLTNQLKKDDSKVYATLSIIDITNKVHVGQVIL